ncbi:hypothetical protein [Nonomuraea sp. NPDC049784]|uniref:hypothetical protein n=1 Tax=Nonomuraea sp. NPDC049784 TaxID=3154361 RepID=UPI0033D9DE1B
MTNRCNHVTKMLVRASLVIFLSTESVTSIARAGSRGEGQKGHQATVQALSTPRRAKFSLPTLRHRSFGVNITACPGWREIADAKIMKGRNKHCGPFCSDMGGAIR